MQDLGNVERAADVQAKAADGIGGLRLGVAVKRIRSGVQGRVFQAHEHRTGVGGLAAPPIAETGVLAVVRAAGILGAPSASSTAATASTSTSSTTSATSAPAEAASRATTTARSAVKPCAQAAERSTTWRTTCGTDTKAAVNRAGAKSTKPQAVVRRHSGRKSEGIQTGWSAAIGKKSPGRSAAVRPAELALPTGFVIARRG